MPTATKPTPRKTETPLTIRSTVTVQNLNGLDSRPAAMLIKRLSAFRCQVLAECSGEIANTRSMLGLLGLAAGPTSKITFTATGVDAEQAIEAIRQLFTSRFGENK